MNTEVKEDKGFHFLFENKILIGIAIILIILIVIIIFAKKSPEKGEIIISDNIKTIHVNEKKKIDAVVKNYDDAIIKYQSSDDTIIKIENDEIMGVSIGKAKVIVSCNISNVEPIELSIEVIDAVEAITEAKFKEGELVIGINEEYDLDKEIIINPSHGKVNSKVFVSSNQDVASVSELGILNTKKEGMTNISVNINNYFNSTITVFVVSSKNTGEIIKNADKIIFKKDSLKLKVGEKEKIEYSLSPENSSAKYLKITSSDEKIATIDKEGNIKALKVGKCYIVAKTIDNKEYQMVVEVYDNDILISDIKVETNQITMKENESKNVSIKITPANATNTILIIKSSDSKIVTAENKNNYIIIKALKEGKASITIESTNGIKDTIEVTVNKKEENDDTTDEIVSEDNVTDEDYNNRGYSISTTTANLNRTYKGALKSSSFENKSIITFKSKNDKLNIKICDYLYGNEQCNVSSSELITDEIYHYEVKDYGMHVIIVYEEGKVKIPYYVYLVSKGYTVSNLYSEIDKAKNNPIKAQAEVSFTIEREDIAKLKVCWTDENSTCNPLTELNNVKPITKINNKLYLNNAKLWKVIVLPLDSNDKAVDNPTTYYINVIK